MVGRQLGSELRRPLFCLFPCGLQEAAGLYPTVSLCKALSAHRFLLQHMQGPQFEEGEVECFHDPL